ncbi:DciA family protein [Streptomyces sp. NPDC058682]|uniref:DciA family protein n=1 Tax=Streptomyces sp. NPDC058682 TaxID=3346596 RepID=UPI003646CA12
MLLQRALFDLVSERGWVIPDLNPLLVAWTAIVGPEIAAHLAVVDIDDGTFIVRADSKAWAARAQLLAPQLVSRLNQDLDLDLDHEAVRTLRVLSPQDYRLPAERVPFWQRAGLVNAQSAPGPAGGASQSGDEEPAATPFYAPPSPPDALPAPEAVRLLAQSRARASRHPWHIS